MYKNIILASILVLFFSFQIATSLKCHVSISATKYESKECTKDLAKNHTDELGNIYNVSKVESDSFNCFSIKLTKKEDNKNSTTVKGCGFKSLNCTSIVLSEEAGKKVKQDDCKVCDKDNCNPAGRIYENLSLISVSAVVALIVKAFN